MRSIPRALMRAWPAGVLALGAALSACERTLPPEGQLVVYVTTDAPVGPGLVPSLFDRLRIEVFPPGEREPCAGCSREFSTNDVGIADGRASFGFFPRPSTPGYRARARLFRSLETIRITQSGGGTKNAEPRRASTIDVTAALPEIDGEGVTSVTLLLELERLAKPSGSLEAPVVAQVGRPPAGLVGSHPSTARVGCSGAPRDEEACVPGGAAWMGNPQLDVLDANEFDGRSERLVVLAPFFLDRAEVTVAELREARVARVGDDPVEASASDPRCTYTPEAGATDAHPVNCLSWQRAAAFCAKVGKRLPSEAEYEYAAGALEARPFPWGSALPACEDAVHARGDACAGPPGPAVGGSARLDRIAFGERVVVDLAGNLREFVMDRFRRSGDACWGEGIFDNPVCDPTPKESNVPRSVRGGSHGDQGTLLRTALRGSIGDERFGISPLVGFRCARDAR